MRAQWLWQRIPGLDRLLNERLKDLEVFLKGFQRDKAGGFVFEGRVSLRSGGTFTDGDTTPSVDGGSVYRTANTAGTTITDFDDAHEEQLLIVIAGDNNTTVQNTASTLELQGGGNYVMGIRDTLMLVYDNGYWHEVARSNN